MIKKTLLAITFFFISTNLFAAQTQIAQVNGMMCIKCQKMVTEALQEAMPNAKVKVSWPEGVAFINFENATNFSEEDFKKVIEDAGFAVGKVATLDEKILDPKSGLISLKKF